MPDVIGITAA
jgi:hypothetical protein